MSHDLTRLEKLRQKYEVKPRQLDEYLKDYLDDPPIGSQLLLGLGAVLAIAGLAAMFVLGWKILGVVALIAGAAAGGGGVLYGNKEKQESAAKMRKLLTEAELVYGRVLSAVRSSDQDVTWDYAQAFYCLDPRIKTDPEKLKQLDHVLRGNRSKDNVVGRELARGPITGSTGPQAVPPEIAGGQDQVFIVGQIQLEREHLPNMSWDEDHPLSVLLIHGEQVEPIS